MLTRTEPASVKPAIPSGAERVVEPGQVIAGKYEVERVLGVGGMGVVVAARQAQLGRRVAIKFVRGEVASDPNAAARFLREARAAVALSSEHVAKVLDVGALDSGAPFMVMEYLAGVDLGQVLHEKGALAIDEAVGAILQACEAIAEAHSIGIVHRDLKPTNLFVTKRHDGSPLVKVLDFGISKVGDGALGSVDQQLTASGFVMGSPGYMSPEQIRNAKTVDARSDIWSLGVILYELLTGTSPFPGDTLGETLAKILSEPPKPIRQVRPDVPEGLAMVVALCLERDVDRRVQNIAQLAQGLERFGPPEGAVSVQRVSRIAAGSVDGPGLRAGARIAQGARVETSPAWQQSGSVPFARGPSRKGRLFVLVVGLAVLSLGVIGFQVLWGKVHRAPVVANPAASEPKEPQPANRAMAAPAVATSAMVLPTGPVSPSATTPADSVLAATGTTAAGEANAPPAREPGRLKGPSLRNPAAAPSAASPSVTAARPRNETTNPIIKPASSAPTARAPTGTDGYDHY